MKQTAATWFRCLTALTFIALLGACSHKKPAPAPQTPPPPPPSPTAQISANPTTIAPGQSATLQWSTENATDVRIDPMGKVDLSGQRGVTPDASTTYHLTATGPGGTQEATARITVQAPAPVAPPTQEISETTADSFNRTIRDRGDVFFDYDSYSIRPDAQTTLQGDAQWLKQHPDAKLTIEGHCDERGSTEYNLTLGDNRARATRDALVQMGIPAGQLTTISFGKEKPFCTDSNEQCWQQNRRGHFTLGQGAQ